MPESPQITIRELIALGLPAETRVLAGHAHLNRAISWVVSIAATESAMRLTAGDFVFLLPPYSDDLAARLARLAEIGAAGVAIPAPARARFSTGLRRLELAEGIEPPTR